MSLGRVQTATLALIVDKELEILGHKAEPFWELEVDFKSGIVSGVHVGSVATTLRTKTTHLQKPIE